MRGMTTRSILAATLAALLSNPAAAADAAKPSRDGWPGTPAAAMARKWVKAFSKGEAAMRACLVENLAPEALAERGMPARMEGYRTLHERLGDLMLLRVVSSAPDRIVAALATSEMSEREFTFEVQPRPPHKLLRVSFKDSRARHGGGHGGGHGGHDGGAPH